MAAVGILQRAVHARRRRPALSSELAADLHEWNAVWQARDETEPVPDGWIERGRQLHARMQAELDAVAEVRPDFELP